MAQLTHARLLLLLCLLGSGLTLPAFSQVTYPYSIKTIAGAYPLGDGGPATSAMLEFPASVAVDNNGNILIGDADNLVIRKVDSNGIVSTVAGFKGAATDIKVDPLGNLYIATVVQVFRLSPGGTLTTIAGNGSVSYSGDGGRATDAAFSGIVGIALDKAGNLYISDMFNNRVRKVTTDGIIKTFAGDGSAIFKGDNGPALAAGIDMPAGVVVDGNGAVYIADYWNDRVRKVSPEGIISTVAGNGLWGLPGDNGQGTEASIRSPYGLALDSNGNLYISESDGARVRKLLTTKIIQTVAGNGNWGFAGDESTPSNARLATPMGLAVDQAGNLLIADMGNQRIRKVEAGGGKITTLAGRSHFGGDNGPATAALFQRPEAVAISPAGDLYIADSKNNRIRMLNADGTVKTVAGTGEVLLVGDGGPAASSTVWNPGPMVFDSIGNLYVIDRGNVRVRKISSFAGLATGTISAVIGSGQTGFSGDGGAASSAAFRGMGGIAIDKAGNLYVSDIGNNRVRKVTPDGQISTVAGSGAAGFGGDGGLATSAQLNSPFTLAVDNAGNLYIDDFKNYRVRKVAPNGIISTVAGTGTCCTGGDNGPATSARISTNAIAVDGAGNLYISSSATIRKIDSAGIIRQIAGNGDTGFSGDGGPALSANLRQPYGMAIDSAGNVFLTDKDNNRVRKLEVNVPAKMEIADGDNQTGTAGQPLAKALRVRVLGSNGNGVPGMAIAFAVASGDVKLSAPTSITDQNGVAAISATPNKEGAASVSATAGTLKVTFTMTALAGGGPVVPVPNSPKISAGGIVQQGYSVPSVQKISTGAIVTIFGENFTALNVAPSMAPLTAGKLPGKHAGVCVNFGGVAAPIFGVTPFQVTVQVPAVAPGNVAVQVIRNCADADEAKSNLETITAQAATPEFLYLKNNSDGNNPVAAHDSISYKWVGPLDLIPGVSTTPAKSGDYITLYGVGFGATTPAFTPGLSVAAASQLAQKALISIGGVSLSDSEILYIGLSPNYVGLYQINIKLPAGVPDGNQPITLQVGGSPSPAGAYLAVKQ